MIESGALVLVLAKVGAPSRRRAVAASRRSAVRASRQRVCGAAASAGQQAAGKPGGAELRVVARPLCGGGHARHEAGVGRGLCAARPDGAGAAAAGGGEAPHAGRVRQGGRGGQEGEGGRQRAGGGAAAEPKRGAPMRRGAGDAASS
eukprot:3892742-Prymnesium_polylepis.2